MPEELLDKIRISVLHNAQSCIQIVGYNVFGHMMLDLVQIKVVEKSLCAHEACFRHHYNWWEFIEAVASLKIVHAAYWKFWYTETCYDI